ncbi:MAG: hypothetical protein U5R31_07355 [Acidimicrobiia bacterium]|nr:hypothetical protein [Acidimicrobiia bacterium]
MPADPRSARDVTTLDEGRRPRPIARRPVAGDGWPGSTIVGIVLAVVIAGPLVALPLSFVVEGQAFDQISRTLLPEALLTSLLLGLGVGAGTLAGGGASRC